MKTRIIAVLTLISVFIPLTGRAQALWTSAEFRAPLSKTWRVGAEAEYRTADGLDGSDRWSLAVGADYRLKFLRLDIGYKFIEKRTDETATRKGNIIPAYWTDRHRLYASVTGKLNIGRLTLSLRERYQFTRRMGKWVPKYASDGVTAKDDEHISFKSNSILRSRIAADYNIRKSRFTPEASVEFFDNLDDGFRVDKIRFTAGTDFRINRHNSLSIFYRYILVPSRSDSDDRGNVIGIGYVFKL